MPVTALLAGRVYTPQLCIEQGCVLIEDSRICAVGRRGEIELPAGVRICDLGDGILAPGFIDIHVHGAGGHDVMEGTREALSRAGRTLLEHGTTAYLATTVTAPRDTTLRILESLSAAILSAREEITGKEALPLGIHLEGPFISQVRRGVHPAALIQPASPEMLQQMLDAARGEVRILTLAPESEGADALIHLACQRGVIVALGHSDATYRETLHASECGASHAVHLFNAMRPFHHRETGIVGAVLTEKRLTAELIADGVHVAGSALRLALAAKGVEQLVLVTDGSSATGMPDGRYFLGTIPVTVQAGVCRDADGKLAGSVLTLDRAVPNMMELGRVDLSQALTMATLNPARLLGLTGRQGVLAADANADLVWLDSHLQVQGTVIRGHANF